MPAEYDSRANAVAIDLIADPVAERGEAVDDRCTVALAGDRAIHLEILYPDLGYLDSLAAAAVRYDLDREALEAAARSALAAPDRVVALEVRARAVA